MFFLKTITISIIAIVTIIATNTWHKIEPHTQNLVVYQESQTGFALGTLGHTQRILFLLKGYLCPKLIPSSTNSNIGIYNYIDECYGNAIEKASYIYMRKVHRHDHTSICGS